MKIATIFKSSLLIVSMLGGMLFNRVTNKEYSETEIRQRIEKRIDVMRKAVDSVHGKGFFDKVSTGEVSKEQLEKSGISLFHVSNVDSYEDI